MIEEMSQVLQQKAGLSPEQANEVSQIVLDHIKSKVPPQFQSFLNPILGGTQPAADGQPAASGGGLGGLLGAASSLFGGKS